MRGKVSFTLAADVCRRITPAYAGKSHSLGISLLLVGDHPRLCGEKENKMRKYDLASRITPAYAGKREVSTLRVGKKQDHPRLCGEKCCFCIYSPVILGSPPPMRGKDHSTRWHGNPDGITPAYAGKSFKRFFARSMYQDHPRLCGEKQ